MSIFGQHYGTGGWLVMDKHVNNEEGQAQREYGLCTTNHQSSIGIPVHFLPRLMKVRLLLCITVVWVLTMLQYEPFIVFVRQRFHFI